MSLPKTAAISSEGRLRVWPIGKHLRLSTTSPVCPRYMERPPPMSQMGHVWTAPGWQGFSSRRQHWSEQPCVRPVSAVHVTAGHNALRGSGPDQNLAFDNALTQVGCPDHRIDRFCITCCSPFPTIHITPRSRRDLTPQARRVLCSTRPWPSSPTPSAPSIA